MSIRDMEGKVEDKIPINYVLLSLFDKSGLEDIVPAIVEINPDVLFMSTGGTYRRAERILGEKASRLIEVAEYTGFPEMEGGLVKTLNPIIHAGILGERNNPLHQEYLKNLSKRVRVKGVPSGQVFDAVLGRSYNMEIFEGRKVAYIDMVLGNFYPFKQASTAEGATLETSRGNIDIGGPAMMRAAAKNFPSCAAVWDPADYRGIIEVMKANEGCLTLEKRAELAQKVWKMTSSYDAEIAKYMEAMPPKRMAEFYLGGK